MSLTNLSANNSPAAIRRFRENWERAFGQPAQLALPLQDGCDPALLNLIQPSRGEAHSVLTDRRGQVLGHLYGMEVKDERPEIAKALEVLSKI